jgi:hypothetical protein
MSCCWTKELCKFSTKVEMNLWRGRGLFCSGSLLEFQATQQEWRFCCPSALSYLVKKLIVGRGFEIRESFPFELVWLSVLFMLNQS